MFQIIDQNNWPRVQMYYYFSQMAPTGFSMTVDVDVTKLVNAVKQRGIKFFPAYLWLVTHNLNKQIEFKCAIKDGELGYYDVLAPLYPTWHENAKTFSLMWIEYNEDFRTFYDGYIENQKKYGENKGVLSRPDLPPANAYTVSSVPWIDFQHVAIHSYENKPYYFPSVEAGRYHEVKDKLLMPLSITCHHATTDGYHVSEFIKSLQKGMDHFDEVLERCGK